MTEAVSTAGAPPKVGHRIEFLSDALTDKGPATGEVSGVKMTVDGYYVTVQFADGQQSFSWDDLMDAGADVRGNLWMVKAHVKGHMRGQHYVKPYERGGAQPLPPHHHPKLGDKGEKILVKAPHHPSAESTWDNPDAVATFVPGGDVPRELNGVPIRRWRDAPVTAEGWEYCDGVNHDLAEPAFHVSPGKSVAAGVVVEEKDGRVWVIHPTNAYGGYKASFPKGGIEKGLSLQATACKETYEEAGLKVKITGFLMDVERTTSKARFYRAVRVGGDPSDCGWESEAVSLIPRSRLYEILNMHTDHPVAEAVGAGPAPKMH